jgi:hypothetical protein
MSFTQLGPDFDGEGADARNGSSVSLSSDGTIVALGALGSNHVRLYQWNSETVSWNQLGADIDGDTVLDKFGQSVSLSSDGTIVAIGAIDHDGDGHDRGITRIYKWNGTAWNQLGSDISGEGNGDKCGYSVSLSSDGTIVAIGAIGNNNKGHTRIYKWSGTAWNQLGSDIDGEAANDQSGYSVSLSSDGSTVAIGAMGHDGNAGLTRIYQWDGSAWNKRGSDIDGEAANDKSGYSVSLSSDGSTVAIGSFTTSGYTRIYQWNGTAWSQLGADIDGEAANDFSGYSVSLSSDGTIVAIGAPASAAANNSPGHTRLYQWSGTAWVQIGTDVAGEAINDQSGWRVSLSSDGSTVAIAANQNDGNGNR